MKADLKKCTPQKEKNEMARNHVCREKKINKEKKKKKMQTSKHKSEFKTSTSPNGFCSNCFGPIWYTLHLVSLSYPVFPTIDDKVHFSTWMESWQHTLPCSVCRNNFVKNLSDLGWDWGKPNRNRFLRDRHSFAEFLWRLHNHINEKLNKGVQVSWEQFNLFYEHLRATDCSSESCKVEKPRGAQCILRIVPENYPQDQLFCIDQQCVPTCAMTCIRPNIQ